MGIVGKLSCKYLLIKYIKTVVNENVCAESKGILVKMLTLGVFL